MSNQHQQILSLIEDSPEFTYLHNHFNRFNPFKVLQVDNYEIRHSNVLAWLLDPSQNHNLGPYFINKFLSKVFVNPANYDDEDKIANYDVLKLSRSSYHDLIVYKELATANRKRIDLLAVSHLNKVVVLIENKFWSSESEGQLEEYIEFVKKFYEGYKIVPVFLTLQDEEPTHEDYLMLGYSDVLDILKNLVETTKEYMNLQVASFISYYIDILEDQLVQNEVLNEKGLSVYKNHKEAIEALFASSKSIHDQVDENIKEIVHHYKETIDFIVKVGKSLLREAFVDFARKQDWPEHLYTPHFSLPNFIEQKWYETYDENDLRRKWWMNTGLIAWFERVDNRLKLKLEVGPLHHEMRENLLKALVYKGVSIKEKAFEEGTKYTGIYVDYAFPSSWEDKQSILESMEKIYRKESFQLILRQISEAIDIAGQDNLEEIHTMEESTDIPQVVKDKGTTTMQDAFMVFAEQYLTSSDLYYNHRSLPSYVEQDWTQLPAEYKVTEKYWLGFPLVAWFEMKNTALRLIIEVGPSEHPFRNNLLDALEKNGISVKSMAYEEGRKYTRIYSKAIPINDMENCEEIRNGMETLYTDREYQETILKIRGAINSLQV